MKTILSLANFFLLTGTTLLLVFLTLSGSVDHTPFNKFYWLTADTSGIENAYPKSAWTVWGVCDATDFSECLLGPAFPISPVDNFGTIENVPEDFIANRSNFYYLSRFGFAFLLISLGFSTLGMLTSLFGFCFLFIDKVMIVLVTFSLINLAALCSCQTAAIVLARNAFHDADLDSLIGVKSVSMMWAAFAAILLVFFNTCAANIANSYKKHIASVHETQAKNIYDSPDVPPPQTDASGIYGDESSFTRSTPVEKEEDGSGGIRFFRIKRNQKTSDDESV